MFNVDEEELLPTEGADAGYDVSLMTAPAHACTDGSEQAYNAEVHRVEAALESELKKARRDLS